MESSKVTPLGVAIVGLGTVGSGVARLLGEFGPRTARHAGRPLVLKHVVVRDAKKPRQVELPAKIISTDIARITSDPDISIVAAFGRRFGACPNLHAQVARERQGRGHGQ